MTCGGGNPEPSLPLTSLFPAELQIVKPYGLASQDFCRVQRSSDTQASSEIYEWSLGVMLRCTTYLG